MTQRQVCNCYTLDMSFQFSIVYKKLVSPVNQAILSHAISLSFMLSVRRPVFVSSVRVGPSPDPLKMARGICLW